MTISSRQFTMRNKVPFVYFLDEMTTVNIKNFETLPSVLREYLCAFVLLTQSGSKVENQYGRLDRSSVEANFGNQFFGRTKDVESLKYYPMMFGKEEKERRSRSAGKAGKHEQERDRIVPERGHLSGKGFCGSGTRGVHRFRHAEPTPSFVKREMRRQPCPMFGSLSRESWAGTSQGFLRGVGVFLECGGGGLLLPLPFL